MEQGKEDEGMGLRVNVCGGGGEALRMYGIAAEERMVL